MQQATPNTDDLIGISEAARRVGVDKSVLSRQVRDGKIRSHDGKVRLSEVLEDRAANIDLTRTGKGAEAFTVTFVDGQAMPYPAAKALKETYLAQLRKLEFEERAGRLVSRAAAEAAFFDEARAMRGAWIAWPARVAIEMADKITMDPETGRADARSVAQVLAGFVRQHLSDMGEDDLNISRQT